MPRKSRKNVGLIGLGIIGSRAAASLRASGYHVFVWNRTPKPAPNFLGSPAEIAEICEVIQLFVADSQAVFQMLEMLGDSLSSRHVVVCSSTIGAEATLEAARLVEGRGARFLDAPFTGSRGAAERSQLVYYVGGEETVYARVKPILEATSKAIVRCGRIGDAATIKVVTNLIAAVSTQVLAEALAITRSAGISVEVFAAALEQNACRSGTLDLKLPKMSTADYDPHFSLKHMFKDVQLGIHLANSLDLEIPATTVTAGVMYGALNNGWADLDFSSIYKIYEGVLAQMQTPGSLPPSRLGDDDDAESGALLLERPRADEQSLEPGAKADATPTPASAVTLEGPTAVAERVPRGNVPDAPKDGEATSTEQTSREHGAAGEQPKEGSEAQSGNAENQSVSKSAPGVLSGDAQSAGGEHTKPAPEAEAGAARAASEDSEERTAHSTDSDEKKGEPKNPNGETKQGEQAPKGQLNRIIRRFFSTPAGK